MSTHQSHLNNANYRYSKQINFNLNNVNHYYNSTKQSSIPQQSYSACNNNNNNTINKTKPYRNITNNTTNKTDNSNHNNNDTFIEYLQKPIKMQREEIIIERSQLVMNGNENSNTTNTVQRSSHYTQVNKKIIFFNAFLLFVFISIDDIIQTYTNMKTMLNAYVKEKHLILYRLRQIL